MKKLSVKEVEQVSVCCGAKVKPMLLDWQCTKCGYDCGIKPSETNEADYLKEFDEIEDIVWKFYHENKGNELVDFVQSSIERARREERSKLVGYCQHVNNCPKIYGEDSMGECTCGLTSLLDKGETNDYN